VIDVFEFESAVHGVAKSPGAASLTRETLEAAVALYADDLLPDLYDDWLEPKRRELRQDLAEVLTRLSSMLELSGELSSGIVHATRLLGLDPLREAYYRILMRLHLQNHDRSSALRVYHQCMRTLQRELGVSPSKETQEIFMQALKSEKTMIAPAGRVPDLVRRPPSIVGRKAGWEALVSCWQRVSKGGVHVALLMGEAGIGKTRLAEEFFDHCARDLALTALRCRCYLAQGQLAYSVVAELLKTAPLTRAREHLSKSQIAELARILPELLVEHPDLAPPQPMTENWQRLHLYEAQNSVVRAAPKPLLLFIDDLQWCDSDSLSWLQALFSSNTVDRMLLLGTVRPEETGRDHPLSSFANYLRRTGQLSELHLAGLSEEETLELAAQLTGRAADHVLFRRLYETTKGNPLFVVESVRASMDGSSPGTIPPGIQAVIAARLAQLSPQAYEIAGLAATIGRPFSFDLLAKALDWDEESLSRALEELWQRRIIEGQGAATYDYTHGLLREVSYSELSPIRQRWLHRRVARALEEMHSTDLEGVCGSLAAHYDAAGMAQEAIRFYREAAKIARSRFADAEAAALLRRALELSKEFPETAQRDGMELELLLMLGPSLVTTKGYSMPEVGDTYQRGLLISRRIGGRDLFSVQSGAWLFHLVRGDVEESRKVAQDCVDHAVREGVHAQEMAARFLLGTSLFHLGRLAESWQQIDQAALSSDGPPHPALALFAGPDIGVFSRAYVSHLRCMFGNIEQCIVSSEEAILRARAMSNPFPLGIALDYAAMLNVYLRDSARALAYAREASEVCEKHGFAYYLAVAEILAGWSTAMEGDSAAGGTRLRGGIDLLRLTGAELRLPFYYGLMAEVCALAGRSGEALANVASGFAYLSKNGEAWAAPELHRIHADLLLESGDAAHAQASYRRAVQEAQQLGARYLESRAAGGLRKLLKSKTACRSA
jgi:predicted ATPase